jgi:hypothetical protein
MILSWDKPEKIMSKEAWQSISADGAPPGVYSPNMSHEDMKKWKAKFIGGKSPRVEIRKTTDNGTQVLIVVTNGGFPCKVDRFTPEGIELHSKGKNVRISQNGPAFFSFAELESLQQAVTEAKAVLTQRGTHEPEQTDSTD